MNVKGNNDQRQFRSLRLSNRLQVLLISCPTFTKSAAAMDVTCGSMYDAKDSQGTAHFLEHLLFLGTKKYPQVDEYNQYLSCYQGSSNAYTAAENTNYHFDVNHDGLYGALERFAQFFITPTFASQYVERERRAVYSEHQKNLQDDSWRLFMILRSLTSEDHPYGNFSTGNQQTLAHVDADLVKKFYEDNYSANNMRLAVLSNKDLDTLEKWCHEFFTPVTDKDIKAKSFSPQLFPKEKMPVLVKAQSIRQEKHLELVFSLPVKDNYWKSKPYRIISHLLGHEAKGSLLDGLKLDNLATEVNVWTEGSSFNCLLFTDITLTKKGLDSYREVIAMFFAYLDNLRGVKLPQYVFDDEKELASLRYRFREFTSDGDVASWFANKMRYHDALQIEQKESLFYDHSDDDLQLFLRHIIPENTIALLSWPTATGSRTEPYYNSVYDRELLSIPKKFNTANIFSLPTKNPYIATDASVTTSSTVNKGIQKIAFGNLGAGVWEKDTRFKVPKACVLINIVSCHLLELTPTLKSLNTVYLRALNETLNKWLYTVDMAGISVCVESENRGLQIHVDGFHPNMLKVIQDLSGQLKTIDISQDQFLEVLDSYRNRLVSVEHCEPPYQLILYELQNFLHPTYIHRHKIYNPQTDTDLISTIDISTLKNYIECFWQKIAFETVIVGAFDDNNLTNFASQWSQDLKNNASLSCPLWTTPNKLLAQGSHHKLSVKSYDTNSAWLRYTQFGARNLHDNVMMRIMSSFLQPLFFKEMRTNKQLGYVVFASRYNTDKYHGWFFLVQSSDYSVDKIESEYEQWVEETLKELDSSFNEEQFNKIKLSVVEELSQPERTLSDRHQTLTFEHLTLTGNFNYNLQLVEAAKDVSYANVLTFMRKVLTLQLPTVTVAASPHQK